MDVRLAVWLWAFRRHRIRRPFVPDFGRNLLRGDLEKSLSNLELKTIKGELGWISPRAQRRGVSEL
jgi:hypothetical protein